MLQDKHSLGIQWHFLPLHTAKVALVAARVIQRKAIAKDAVIFLM